MVDGACNIGAMLTVCEYVRERSPRDRTVAVVGICKDKEVRQVLEILGEAASRFVLTQANNPRAMMVEELAPLLPENVNFFAVPDPVQAVNEAALQAGSEGFVIVTGSLYLVGEVMRHYREKEIEEI
jgi:dihydrofolate synthase/folylpolyglutamate synthase